MTDKFTLKQIEAAIPFGALTTGQFEDFIAELTKPMRPKGNLLARLKSWEDELHNTKSGNLSAVAPKIIAELKDKIKELSDD